tara:strand:- start:946 stop:1551 length:606 start_codon:yes stop_codon:yes gene_type:complete
MKANAEQIEGIVLKKTLTEKCWRLSILSPEQGLWTCFLRQSSKKNPAPDIFDEVVLKVSTSSKTQLTFIEEYRLVKRREGLPKSYGNLQLASRFASIVENNAMHLEVPVHLYTLCQDALAAWDAHKQGAITFFKALYRMITLEGLPVQEAWLKQLPAKIQTSAHRLLAEPLKHLSQEDNLSASEYTSSLEHWTRAHTHIHL